MDEDLKYIRDLHAMFALNGLLKEATGDYEDQAIAELAYDLADAMMKARNKKEEYVEEGIAGITKKKYARKN